MAVINPHLIAWGVVEFRIKKKGTRLNRVDAYVKIPKKPKIAPFSYPEFEPPERELVEVVKYRIPENVDMSMVRAYLLNLKHLGLSNRAIARAIFPDYSESGVAGQISLIINQKRRLSQYNIARWISKVQNLLTVKVKEKELESLESYNEKVRLAYEEYDFNKTMAYTAWFEEKEEKMKSWKEKINKIIRDFNYWYEKNFDFGKDHPLKWQVMECTTYGFDGIIIQKDNGQIYAYQYDNPYTEPKRTLEGEIGGAGCGQV